MVLDMAASCPANLQPSFVCRRGVFFSGRFDGGFKERAIRSVAAEVESRAPFIDVLIVDAANARGAGYAELTMEFLARMELMVAFVFDNYGQFTGNPYSSFGEVTYCLEHRGAVQCLPLKLYRSKRWPPVPPDHDGGLRGATQNEFFFKTDLLYREFPIHDDAELSRCKMAMADCVIDRYLDLHPELRCQDRRRLQALDDRPFPVGQRAQYSWSPKPGQLIPKTQKGPVAEMPFKEGDLVQYVSPDGSSTNRKVVLVDADGCYLDLNPWVKVSFLSIRPSKYDPLKEGDAVLYMSATHGTWLKTRVLRAYGNGHYQVEAKPGCLVSQELLKGA